MKVLHHVQPTCDCVTKLWDFYNQLRGDSKLETGSVVECDCGKVYKLDYDQREDRGFWSRVTLADRYVKGKG